MASRASGRRATRSWGRRPASYALYLRAARHGVGLGRKLHDRALAGITDGGFRDAVLWVIEANAPARRFYERAGWSLDDGVDASPMAWGLNEMRYRCDIP